jgi:3-isopropylmalate/(R)-2-methylmalate dehydratase small subunit
MTMVDTKWAPFRGTAVAVRGNDIDTDRIIPARFLTVIVFDGLGAHVFADDRAEEARAGRLHPLDTPGAATASVLIANKNFGCGSSREHAPQALARFGVQAIVAESFAEIFFGNCSSIGVPCLTADVGSIARLMAAAEGDPATPFAVDLNAMTVTAGEVTVEASMPAGTRELFLTNRWDSLAELLEAKEQSLTLGNTLPYWNGWA